MYNLAGILARIRQTKAFPLKKQQWHLEYCLLLVLPLREKECLQLQEQLRYHTGFPFTGGQYAPDFQIGHKITKNIRD